MVQMSHAPPYRSVSPAKPLWRAAVGWMGAAAEVLAQLLRATSPCLPCHRLLSPSSDSDGDSDLLDNKLTVVLDLDDTLVCTYETCSLPGIVKTRAREAGVNWFELEYVSPFKDCDGKPKIRHVTVFERPGLYDFLKQINEFAVLVLFTSALEVYAKPLVDKIDVENRFSRRLYRPSTVSTYILPRKRGHVKDLLCMSEDLSRVVLVDNNAANFLLQPSNGILCNPFSAWSPNDNELLGFLLPLLKSLARKKDVRPLLRDKFHMTEWFRIHGASTL